MSRERERERLIQEVLFRIDNIFMPPSEIERLKASFMEKSASRPDLDLATFISRAAARRAAYGTYRILRAVDDMVRAEWKWYADRCPDTTTGTSLDKRTAEREKK